jgi:hypothetical protein
MKKTALTIASEMIEQHGDRAELLAADQMDAALLSGDSEKFNEWCLVGKAIALFSRQNQPVNAPTLPRKNPAPAEDLPSEDPIPLRRGARR